MGWASDSVLVRLGLRRSNIFAAMLMSFAVSTACMWSYLIATTSLEFLSSPAMIYFVISGCVQPLLARALFYEGITRIGVARAGPLRGTEPLFATIIGVSFLHEEPGALVYMGTILIMTSLWLISGQHDGAAKWRLLDTAFPISAALVSAISQSLRKQGLKILPDPFVAVAIVTTVSLILFLIFVLITGRAKSLRMERQGFSFFLAAALLATAAQVLNFVALGQRRVVGDYSALEYHTAIYRAVKRSFPAQSGNGQPAHRVWRASHVRRHRDDYQPVITVQDSDPAD